MSKLPGHVRIYVCMGTGGIAAGGTEVGYAEGGTVDDFVEGQDSRE